MDGREDLVTELGRLDHGNQIEPARLLGMIVALAGEVFVLKAQNERLQRAIKASGMLADGELNTAAAEDAMQAWFVAEEQAFTRAVLGPLLQGDKAINATAGMLER